MAYLRRWLQLPANESSVGLVLSLSVVILGLLSIALVWQAEIIAYQREVIRWLEAMENWRLANRCESSSDQVLFELRQLMQHFGEYLETFASLCD
jgi:hypothetical protein